MPSEKPSSVEMLLDEEQQFLQSAVHDLRAAQRRTGIAAELLLELDPANVRERKELTAQMLQGLSKTRELLAGIGRYANALAPHRYSTAVFPSLTAVRFALANLDREIRETGASVTIGDLPVIEGDRERLAELFEHLIANSLKFKGADPPAINITANRVAEGWLFSVTDNGIGIPQKYRDRLFDPFRRLQGADIPGAGLGLASARKIVEGHGGRIGMDNPNGEGVTISFVLPAVDGDQRADFEGVR